MSGHRVIRIPITTMPRSERSEAAGPDRREEYSPLVSVGWVAWYLGVTKARVWELCRPDRIPHTKVGEKSYRFSTSEIIAWAESGGSTEPGAWREEVVR